MHRHSRRPSDRTLAVAHDGAAAHESRAASVFDYVDLTKPEIAFLVGISSIAGFLSGASPALDWLALGGVLAGTVLTAAGAGALNHYVERVHDARMRRTASRPLPSGRISPIAAARFGFLLCAVGIAVLCPLTNWLTAALAILTVVLYLGVYTPLKRRTVHNTLVGTIPGALPVLGGYAAATGQIDTRGLAAFAVLVLWQLPHFYSLAWMYRKDYRRGGYAMLSVNDASGRITSLAALASTVAMVAVTFAPTIWFGATPAYGVAMAALGLWILDAAIRFYRQTSTTNARNLLRRTVFYIPSYVLAIIFDRIL